MCLTVRSNCWKVDKKGSGHINEGAGDVIDTRCAIAGEALRATARIAKTAKIFENISNGEMRDQMSRKVEVVEE